MKKVADILARKGVHVTTVSPDTNVIDALRLMANQNIGSVMVMQDGRFVGIMTERDYSRKVILKGRASTDTQVGDIMSTDFPPITPQHTVEHCMQLLADHHIRYLPVFEGNGVCGIISINDVVKETILMQEETITHLKDYLHTNM
jgi:CBS domain-containing protein